MHGNEFMESMKVNEKKKTSFMVPCKSGVGCAANTVILAKLVRQTHTGVTVS